LQYHRRRSYITVSDDHTGAPVSSGEIRFHSSFAELAGTCVGVDDPSSSIILDPTGSARIVGRVTGHRYVHLQGKGVLMLAGGTSHGPYPVRDGALIFQVSGTGSSPDPPLRFLRDDDGPAEHSSEIAGFPAGKFLQYPDLEFFPAACRFREVPR